MERFEWNALRIGHRVVVHDPASADMVSMPGVVLMVDAHVGRKGVNGVGIRVSDTDGTNRVLWPQYPAVHLHPLDSSEPCWRCEEIAARDDRSRDARVGPQVVIGLAGPPAPRRCGRCRAIFPGDSTLALDLDAGWWACAPCHQLLIGPGAMAVPTWPAKAAARSRALVT